MMNRFHSMARQFLTVLVVALPHVLCLQAQEIRELWVPSEHLDVLLKKKPRAVVLTPEQYQTLILDSQRSVLAAAEKKNTPPVSATVRSVSMTGRVLPGADVIPLTSEYTIESLTDDWTEVPLLFPLTHFGQVEVDDQSALRVTKAKNPVLITHGKGIHKVRTVYHLPVTRTAGGESIEIHSPEIPSASLTLEIEKDMALTSALPFHIQQQKAYFTIPSQSAGCWNIEWAAQKVAPIPGSAIFQTCSWLYTVDSSKVQADLGLVLNANLRRLPTQFTVSLPDKVRLLSVEGSELQRWSRNPGGGVAIQLLPGDRETTDLRLRIEQEVSEPGSGDEYTVSLPIATVQGVHRASGTMTILGSEDISVRQISTGPLTVPIPDDEEGPAGNLPNYVASFQFPVQNEAPSLSFAEIKNRYNAQLDTLVTLNREAITIERTLLYLPIEGNIFDATVSLPDNEQIVSVSSEERDDFTWKESNSTVSLRWDTGLSRSSPAAVTITTRRDPADWYQLSTTPTRLQFASVKVSGAESLSGYIAVAFDSSWLIQTNDTTGLSPRDGRNTPVTGNLAWFRLDDYTLEVDVSRRPPEIEVVNTAYALPLANTLEIEGQLALTILRAGIRDLQIAAPPETSPHIRFESPVIAQQSRDDTTGTWTLTFHRELTGSHPIRYHINLPVEITGDDNNDGEKKFEVALPKLSVPAAKRIRGEWIMEANTDTELSFTTENLDAADSLQITRIDGYQPRHRIISAFQYRDDNWQLTLSGTRHPHSELVKTVIDKLKIDTVVSTNGTNRHQAQITVRTAGDQFLDIKLPPEAVIWTLNVDGERMKPVRSGKDQLRVPLPAHEDNDQQVDISIIYATEGKNWRSSGKENLQPVTLAPQIPVLHSDWQLHLPEGFDYQRFKTNLEKDFSTNERILLGHLAKTWLERRRLAAGQIAAPTEWTDEAAPSEIWYRAFLAGKAAQDLEQQGNLLDAMMKTNEARILYQDIQNRYAHFQPEAVQFKLHTVEEAKRRLKDKIKQQYKNDKTVADSPDGIPPQIASTYVVRMQESVKRADEAALRGSQLIADGDLDGALAQYSNAIDLLPSAPMTDQRRRAYIKQYSKAATQLAKQYADSGRYNEAISLVENVLRPSISPDNLEAKRLLEQLNDPEYYSPALTPQHLERIRKAKMAIKTGQGYLDYGDYDRAEREYFKTLNADRYNSAARRSLEEVERQRLDYYDTARDQTRSTFLREIAEDWELPVPTAIDSPEIMIGTNSSTSEISRNEDKLKSIIIPTVEFSNTPLHEALEFLQQKSVELDTAESDINRKGVNIIIGTGSGVANTPITLRLTNVPLGEALRYTSNLAQLKYKVESHAVVIVPLSTPDADLFTNRYKVPPTFLQAQPSAGGGAAAADPFAPAQQEGMVARRMTVKQALEDAGITFGSGATAIYNPATGDLIVKNTPDQMDLVEAYIESIKTAPTQPASPGSVYKLPDDIEDLEVENSESIKLEEKLKTIRIPSLEFSGTSLKDALQFIQQKAGELDFAESDFSKKGISIAMSDDIASGAIPAPPGDIGNGFGFEGGRQSTPIGYSGDVADTPINLRLTNVPLGEALRYTTNLANLKYRIENGRIVVVPLSAPETNLVSSTYILAPDLQQKLLAAPQDFPAGDPFSGEPAPAPAGPKTVKEIMENVGITFPPGADVSLDPATGSLRVTNSPDQAELVEAWLSSLDEGRPIIELKSKNVDRYPETDSDAFIGNDALKGTAIGSTNGLTKVEELFTSIEETIEGNRESLDATVIEGVDFNGQTVEEALQLLEAKIKELPAGESHAAALRIQLDNIEEDTKKKKLDFSVAKATAIEILDKIVGESDTRYYVTKSGVVIADQNTEILPMETVFLPMPARVFQSLNDDGSIHDHHARNILKAAGINFPRGSSAAYNPSTGRLAVRNTKLNIEAVLNQFATEIKAVEEHPNAPENNLRYSSAFLGGASKLKGFQPGDVGRLPVAFDLPEAGRVYRFQGLYAPDSLDFRYVTWDRQIRSAWGWIIVGLVGFLLLAWRVAGMPLFLGIFIAIFLTFIPFVFGQGMAPFCNSLLLGWLAGFTLWIFYIAVKRITPGAHWCIWLPATILLSPHATAAPPEKPVETHTVYVPYDPEKPVHEQDATRFYLDYDTFTTLWKQAKEFRTTKTGKPENSKPGYTISSSLYRINSTPSRLSVSGRISLSTRGGDWQQIPLQFSGANVSKIILNGNPASFHNGSIVIEKSGSHIVEVEYEIPVGKRQEKASWSIPKSSGVLLEIEMDNDLAEPVVQENWPLAKSSPEGGRTVYTAAIGQQDKITFRRRLKTSGRSMTRPNAAVIDAKLFVAQGIEQIEATYQLNFSGQEDHRFTIAFENTVTPVRFDIPNLSLWEIRNKPGTNLRELTFFLTQPVTDSLSVKFTGERLIDAPSRTFPRLSAEAGRIEQNRHLYRAGGIAIVPKPTANHRQISGAPDSSGFIHTASYSLAGRNEDLAYQVSGMRAKRSAKASYVFQLGAAKLETIAQFQIRSPEEPLLDSRFTIPQSAKIQKIDGNRIKDWWRTGDEIFIRFQGGTPEVTAVLLYITQPVDDSADSFSLPLTSFPIGGFENEEVEGEGLVVAHTTRDISIDFSEERRVIREIGIEEAGKDFEILPPMEKKRGFRFENMNFSATVNSTQLEPGFHSLWVMFGRVHDSWVHISIHADIEVSRSGLDRISFHTSSDVPEFRIPDDDIREVRITEENGLRRYEVIFQQYVTDAISFTMETEIPHSGEVSLPDITITDSDREEKFLIVENLSAQQMQLRPENLATTVMAALPYKPENLASAQLFRAGPNWSLDIEMENLETTAGNQAVILYAELTSAFRKNGEEWLKAVYHIQNRSLQFLPVAKPNGAELVSVVVDEAEVRADRGTVAGNDVILVPLIQTKPGQLAYDVTLVFRSRGDSKLIGKRLRKRLDDPAVFGPTIEKTMWKVHLPADHELVDFKGNMQPIREEESKLRKLQSDLAELKGLNYYSTRAVNDSRSRQQSNDNAQILAERIEQTLREVQEQDEQVEKIEKELDAQKVIITENRIQMPEFEPGSQVDKLTGQIGWLSNSGTIKSRNRDYSNIVQEQTRRLESQVRLNDNISIGNQFFNNIESPQQKTDQKPVLENEKHSQIGHLQMAPQSGSVERKLSRLNNSQNIEQAEVLKKKVSKKEKAQADSERQSYSNARSAFRQIGHGGITAPSTQQADQFAEPDPFGGGAAPKDGIKQGTVVNPTGYNRAPNRVQSDDSDFGNTFQSQGGNSIRVDFPVEGEAFHFQKLKDHAELEIRSKEKQDSGRLAAVFGMLALLGLVVLAKVFIETRKKV